MTEETTEQTLTETIIKTIKEENPETVNKLIEQVVEQNPHFSKQEVLLAVGKLQGQSKLKLMAEAPSLPTFSFYLKTTYATWYWITLALTLSSIVSIFTISESAYPIVNVRYIFGAIFVLWLPGYTFTKALFPNELPIKTTDKNLEAIERIVLSFGMSLALVPIAGLLLNYTPWGIRLAPMTLSLATLTLVFATAGIIREHRARTRNA